MKNNPNIEKSDLPLGQFVLVWKYGGKIWSATLQRRLVDDILVEYIGESGYYTLNDVWLKYEKVIRECEYEIILNI